MTPKYPWTPILVGSVLASRARSLTTGALPSLFLSASSIVGDQARQRALNPLCWRVSRRELSSLAHGLIV